MNCRQLLARSFGRAQEVLDKATEGLTRAEIAWRAGPEANPAGFIIWHLSRVEDRMINDIILQRAQVWTEGAWHEKLGLSEDPKVTGFNFTGEQVDAFPVLELEALLGYQRAVRQTTLAFINGLAESEFDRPVSHWHEKDIPLAALLGRTVVHVSQHAGQIDFIKGLVRNRTA